MRTDFIKQQINKSPKLKKSLKPVVAGYRKSRNKIIRVSKSAHQSIKSFTVIKEYNEYVLNQQQNKDNFVQITEKPFSKQASKKLIAYYLPQYYQIPQNDEWFGRGFTEWSNAAKAVPQFTGHWQPHLPIDTGFYNLDTTKTMHRQIELAKAYGIYGFCFYYYWFSGGDKIMEKPIKNWLEDKDLDLPFMFFWANEDWTNTWGDIGDLGTKTYSAKMKPDDVKKFTDDIIPYLKDDRYITVDGRPHIIIYQAKKDPYLKTFLEEIGVLIEKEGIGRPYISLVFPDDFDQDFNPSLYGADAAVEFGSHLKIMPDEISPILTGRKLVNNKAILKEYDMEAFINNEASNYETDYPLFKGVMTHFDNTARKIYTGAQIFNIPPELYQKWLTNQIKNSKTDQVFIAAWNEWAEGMHLEPDQRYGYAYLQATKNALEESSTDNK